MDEAERSMIPPSRLPGTVVDDRAMAAEISIPKRLSS